ncbi:Ig-like domain-containing protein [Clostridium saccharoperbutylacetonicum]
MDNNITNNNLSITATPVEGKNYVHLEWNNVGEGYSYMVYSKGQDEAVYQSIPSKSDVTVLDIYPSPVQNTGLSGGGKDLDGNVIPDSGILKTWLEKEKISDVKIESVSLTSFNANPSKYLYKTNGKWNFDCVFYGMWNLWSETMYPNDTAIEYLRTFIHQGGGFMTSHHTIGYTGLGKGVNKLAKELGVEIFGRKQANSNAPYSCRDSSGNLFPTVSFEIDDPSSLKTADASDYWNMSTKVQVSKKGLLTNYPFQVGNIGSNFDIPLQHGLSVFGKGDIWMTSVNPTGTTGGAFKEISVSPSTGEKGTNNFYVHTYNNTAIINSGHSFPNISQAETRIIANTLYYLAQLTSNTSCDDHKGQDLTAPDKVIISGASNDDKNLNITYSKPNDNGTKYDYYVKATNGDAANDITSNTVSAVNTSGIAGYSYVVDNIENTQPDNKVITTDPSISVPLSGLDLFKPIYVHIRTIDNAGNASETTHYEYKYITSLNLDKSSLNLNTGDTQNLIATTVPAGMEVAWTSSDPSIATVDSNGNVTGVKEGQATITAKTVQGNLSATCIVTVIEKSVQLVNTAYAKGDNTNISSGGTETIFNGLAETTLSVVKTSDAKISCVGDKITYTIVVTNTGSKTAKNVVIKDNAPKHIKFITSEITITQGTVDSSSTSSNIVANVGDIPVSGTVTITVHANVVI